MAETFRGVGKSVAEALKGFPGLEKGLLFQKQHSSSPWDVSGIAAYH